MPGFGLNIYSEQLLWRKKETTNVLQGQQNAENEQEE